MATVLITDDASLIRAQLRDIITDLGHEVVGEAVDGRDAIEKNEQLDPDVIMMDITMPNLSGTEAVREIRKRDPNVKIIMCSAMGQQRLVVDAIEAGAQDFIVKPFTPERVKQAFLYILSNV